MKLRVALGALLLVTLAQVGCGPKLPPRLKTYPAFGIVHVDGKPVEGVMVTLVPEEGSELKNPASAMTDSNGKFTVGTYGQNDGVPVGTYSLGFSKRSSFQEGRRKDAFEGLFKKAARNNQKVTVVDGKENDFGIIELSTKPK